LYSPIAAIIYLSIGAGAIFQVVLSIIFWIADNNNIRSGRGQVEERRKKACINTSLIAGFIVGIVSNNVYNFLDGIVLILLLETTKLFFISLVLLLQKLRALHFILSNK
jgi:hypothetical protein